MRSRSSRLSVCTRIAAVSAACAVAAACGSSGGGGGADSVPVDISVSDAPVGDLAAVVVTLDRVTINRPGSDIVIETFPNENPGEPDTETITFDLLDFQGMDRLLIVDGVMLAPGSYQNLRLHVVEKDSYVEEADGDIVPLKAPSQELKLGGFTVPAGGPQAFVVEFPLMHAMTYNPSPHRYILKPRGLRIVDVVLGATLSGSVDPSLFEAGEGCADKADPTEGNVVYLYQGHGLDIDALGDLFDPDVDTDAAANLEPPFSAEHVAADGSYLFSYLPAGTYTVAFACDAADDDPELDDGILIPNPADEWIELDVATGEDRICDVPIDGGGCV
jgi:Domain of unknown function (DUF4382)